MQDYRKLEIWQRSMDYTVTLYKFSLTLPEDEKYGLISQLRRAAYSIPLNIAEGFKKRGHKNKINFYNISQGSLEELKYYLILSRDLNYKINFEELWEKTIEVGKMLGGLIRAIDA